MRWLLLALVLVVEVAYSNDPAPAKTAGEPKNEDRNNQKKPYLDKRGTIASPDIIEFSPSSVIKVEATDKTDHRRDYMSSEWWLVYLTGSLCAITLGLAIFTAALWGATKLLVKKTEKTTRIHERAYVFGGGPLGLPKYRGFIGRSSLLVQTSPYNTADDFSEPKRMSIHNYGRTVAYLTKIEWGLYPFSLFKPGVRVSDLIDNKKFPDIRVVAHPAGVIAPTGLEPLLYRQIEFDRKKHVGEVFFGRIWYKDVFGDLHHSTFHLLLNEKSSDSLDSYYDDQS